MDEPLKKEYRDYVEKKAPRPALLKNSICAFVVGGIICCIGQFIVARAEALGYDPGQASTVGVICMIFIGAFLTGIGVYDRIGKHAGAGSIVPITGFANSIVAPAMEFKREGHIFGVGAKMFMLAGPVLVYGITASVITGILYYFFIE